MFSLVLCLGLPRSGVGFETGVGLCVVYVCRGFRGCLGVGLGVGCFSW